MTDMPAPLLPLDLLAGIVAGHVGVSPDTLRLEPCATGKFNTTWFVDGGPQPLVLRIAPPDDPAPLLFYEYRMMRQEPGLHAAIQAHTRVPVPTILAHDASHARIDRDYLLMERMPGTPVSDHPGLTRSAFAGVLEAVGDALRQVHAIHGNAYGYVGPHEPMPPQPDWTSAFVIMWNKLIDDTERCGGYSSEEADSMRKLLDRHIRTFDRREPACLLDWDRAVWGDPEIEFAVLDYCGISEPAFWAGYGSARDTSPEAEVRRVFYLLYELQKYILIRRIRNRSPRRADAYRRQSLQLAGQLG